MSFWSNFSVKAPAVLSGAAGISGLASVVFPSYAASLQGLAALFGFVGASLHSLNPIQGNSQNIVTDPVVITPPVTTVTSTAINASTPDSSIDATVQKVEQVAVTSEQIAQIVNQTITAYKSAS